MYIFTTKDSVATLIGQQGDYDQIITQDTYPARIDHPNTRAVLSYSETAGIHWEYIPMAPVELRERAYETEKLISWDDELLTVDEANKRWQEYQAEGNAKAEQLTALIAVAKADIRARYPDKTADQELV